MKYKGVGVSKADSRLLQKVYLFYDFWNLNLSTYVDVWYCVSLHWEDFNKFMTWLSLRNIYHKKYIVICIADYISAEDKTYVCRVDETENLECWNVYEVY